MREKRGIMGGCGWGLVDIIKRHHWPHFIKRLTHHHHHHKKNKHRLLATEPASEEHDNLIVGDVEETAGEFGHRKPNSIKSLLADEMHKMKGSSGRQRHNSSSSHVTADLINENEEGGEKKGKDVLLDTTNDQVLPQKPKHYLDALDIISANEELLVKVLQDPGSPLAHHFRNEQALSAKRGLVKSETFPLPGTRFKPKFNKAESLLRQGMAQPCQNRVVMKRFKDLKHKIKHAIRERKKEMHRVAMDAVIHKIPHGLDVEKEIDNSQFKNSFQAYDVGGHESDFSGNKPRVRQMRRASSLNESMDRYCQLYQTSLNHRSISHGMSPKAVPKQMSRIYSLPDIKYYIDQKEEHLDTLPSTTRNSEDQTTKCLDVPTIPEDKSQIDSTRVESRSSATQNDVALSSSSTNEQEKIQLDSQRNELQPEHQEELIIEPAIVVIEAPENVNADIECDMSNNGEEEVSAKEFRYVRDILELSGVSGDGLVGNAKGYEEAKGCVVYDPECCGNNKCDHQLLFDLINEVLMEIYGRSYTYYPWQLSSLSRTAPMPVGQHVVRQVWGLISSYLSIKAEDERSLVNVVANDLGKSGWWMNLQFDCECIGIELEDLIFHDILEDLISFHLLPL